MQSNAIRLPQAAALVVTLAVAPLAHADYTLTCGSVGGRHNTCRLTEPGYVSIVRQISGAKCDQGRSWDYDRREIWVDNGCEAEFRVETWRHTAGAAVIRAATARAAETRMRRRSPA